MTSMLKANGYLSLRLTLLWLSHLLYDIHLRMYQIQEEEWEAKRKLLFLSLSHWKKAQGGSQRKSPACSQRKWQWRRESLRRKWKYLCLREIYLSEAEEMTLQWELISNLQISEEERNEEKEKSRENWRKRQEEKAIEKVSQEKIFV